MTEEKLTKVILKKLTDCNWTILAFDFPQSGTGKMIHPDDGNEKNKDGIIPDIVAVKGSICLFLENKDRIDIGDFQKIASLRTENCYKDGIAKLLNGHPVESICYGIGLPLLSWNSKSCDLLKKVDFIVGATEKGGVEFLYNPKNIVL